jgi:hypothetical protein
LLRLGFKYLMTKIDLSLPGSKIICNKLEGFSIYVSHAVELYLFIINLPRRENSFFENLVVAYPIKKYPAIYATRRFLYTCPNPPI